MPIPRCPKPITAVDQVQKAIDLIQEAKEIMDEIMDVYYDKSRLSKDYYAYGQYGIQQALGEGNPNNGSLYKILEQIKEDGEI